jgi:hypothetical protein
MRTDGRNYIDAATEITVAAIHSMQLSPDFLTKENAERVAEFFFVVADKFMSSVADAGMRHY